jgi:hypothetical protein
VPSADFCQKIKAPWSPFHLGAHDFATHSGVPSRGKQPPNRRRHRKAHGRHRKVRSDVQEPGAKHTASGTGQCSEAHFHQGRWLSLRLSRVFTGARCRTQPFNGTATPPLSGRKCCAWARAARIASVRAKEYRSTRHHRCGPLQRGRARPISPPPAYWRPGCAH